MEEKKKIMKPRQTEPDGYEKTQIILHYRSHEHEVSVAKVSAVPNIDKKKITLQEKKESEIKKTAPVKMDFESLLFAKTTLELKELNESGLINPIEPVCSIPVQEWKLTGEELRLSSIDNLALQPLKENSLKKLEVVNPIKKVERINGKTDTEKTFVLKKSELSSLDDLALEKLGTKDGKKLEISNPVKCVESVRLIVKPNRQLKVSNVVKKVESVKLIYEPEVKARSEKMEITPVESVALKLELDHDKNKLKTSDYVKKMESVNLSLKTGVPVSFEIEKKIEIEHVDRFHEISSKEVEKDTRFENIKIESFEIPKEVQDTKAMVNTTQVITEKILQEQKAFVSSFLEEMKQFPFSQNGSMDE